MSAIVPLLVTTAIVFEWFPDVIPPGTQLGILIGAMLLGWIGMGFSSFPKRWLKVLVLVIYPFAMLPLLFLAIVRHLPIL